MTMLTPTRRSLIKTGLAAVALAPIAAPHVANAQAATLRITTWGGKWGDAMKGSVLPAFEQEFKCKVEADTAFPFIPKLQASPKNAPVYDVLHANGNEQWGAAVEGMVMDKITAREVPNIKDTWPFATSKDVAGVMIFVNAIGLAYRTDKGLSVPTSWKDLADPKYAGVRGAYQIPVNSLGQAHFLMLGQVYGKGMKDLDAAYKALEQLKPIKLFDFVGGIEKSLSAGEINIGVLHDSGVYRYFDQKLPIDFVAPSEGVMALDQVLNVTTGSKMKELAYAFIDYMLRPAVQKQLAEIVWYSPTNKTVKLAPEYDQRLTNTPEKVAKLIQVDWKWYNQQKDEIDARVARILRG